MPDNYLSKLGKFASQLVIGDLGKDVVAKAKLCILDAISCAYAGFHLESSRTALQVARSISGGTGKSTVWVEGTKNNPLLAAFNNCLLVHSMLHDDMNETSVGHVGNMVIPAALALAESEGVNGSRVLPAIVAGYEVMGRVGGGASYHSVRRGFRGSPTYGPFGVAAAVSKVLGLNEGQLTNAIACAASFSMGLLETVNRGSMEWRFQNGMAVMGGIIAALSAKNGLTSADTIMEGEYGFLSAFCGPEAKPSILRTWDNALDTLGVEFDIMTTHFKPYATCGYNQIGFEVAVKMVEENDIQTKDIQEIVVNVSPENKAYPGGDSHGPWSTPDEALLSKPFAIGVALVFKELEIDAYGPEKLNHPELLRVARLVRSEAVEGMGGLFCDIRMIMKDGRVFEGNQNLINIENFLLNESLAEKKLKDLSKDYISEDQAEEIVRTVMNLENLSDVSGLTRLISGGVRK